MLPKFISIKINIVLVIVSITNTKSLFPLSIVKVSVKTTVCIIVVSAS